MELRRFLPLAAGVAAVLATAVPATASTAPIQLTMPAPTGPDAIGTVSLHLVQAGRPDPWVPGQTRELMVSLWYPARHADRYPTVPYMTPGAWSSFEHNRGIPADSVVVPQTAGHDGAPVDRHPGGLPVILYSPPSTGDRAVNTALVQELASRGYLVATVDHTYSDDEVEFPDGRVAQRVLPNDQTLQQLTDEVAERDKDTRFLLDELTAIDHGANPDAERHPLPQGLCGALDLNRVGMFGHSLGGATTFATMLDDPRIKAGVDMDGTLFGPVVTAGLNRPAMLLAHQDKTRDTDPSWGPFWNASTGWKRDFQLQGSRHLSYSDAEVIFPQTASVMGLTPVQLAAIIGTIDPARAIKVQSSYVDAFFELHLRHHDEHLLDGPSPRFPEMLFQP
ncbi:alpha/beta hydrolase family protein [Actinocrispum wychmicini]|uniref:Platelet-activating factor acetylhydrolase isoform II n=1 Tax=Actinocrispum wychmicini TaxID=1213861 RepID=A0A4R2K7C4_9PSEU|nr:hydrolase [Actinocrispum wychmicini]TCO65849.1 platelet-activating factor acetylhydrolase isoform II [Actinocrispum wychmicini]